MSTESPDEFVSAKSSSSRISSALESAAIADACKKSGADIILDPKFTIDDYSGFLGFSNETTAKVEGVPAKIIGAKEVPLEEVCKQIVLQRQQESMSNLKIEDNYVPDDNTLSIKYGLLKTKYDYGYGMDGDINDLKIQFYINLIKNLSLGAGLQKLEGGKDSSFEALIYNIDLKYKLLHVSNCSLSFSLGLSCMDYDYSYTYRDYYYYHTYVGYGNRFYFSNAGVWEYEYYRPVSIKTAYNNNRSHSDNNVSPMAGMHFKYENDKIYLGANCKYIKAYGKDIWYEELYFLMEDILSLDLELGLKFSDALRLDVNYMNGLGKENLSGIYGGLTLLF